MNVSPVSGPNYFCHQRTVVFHVKVFSTSGKSVILVCRSHYEDELAFPTVIAITNNWRPNCDNRGWSLNAGSYCNVTPDYWDGLLQARTNSHMGRKHVGSRKMPSSGILRRVALVTSDHSEERIVSIIWVTRIGKVGTKLAVTSKQSILRRNILFQLPVISNVVPSTLILFFALMMEAIISTET
jgi:hypothetical protein